MKKLLWLAILLGSATSAHAAGWDVFTNVRSVRQLIADSNHIFAATSGGLYINDYTSLRAVRIYNTGSGLGSHDLNALAQSGNTMWVGGRAGILSALDMNTESVEVYPLALGVSTIEALAVAPDTVWVGTDVGLGLFLPKLNGGVFKEVYSHLGSLPADMAVRDILLTNSDIWLVTEAGIVRAQRGDPELHLPSRWTTYTDSITGLAAGRVVAIWRDSVYVGTDSGLVVLAGVAFESRFSSEAIRSMYADGDTLWLGTAHGVYFAAGDSIVQLPTQNLKTVPVDGIVRRPGKELWVALPGNDLYYHLLGSIWFISLPWGQPASNTFREVALRDGRVWTALYGGGANYIDLNGTWRAVPNISPTTGAPTLGVTTAPHGVYFHGWGQGFHWARFESDSLRSTQFNATNTALGGVANSPSYTVVTDVVVDGAGARWVANRLAADGQVVVYFPPAGAPQAVYGQAQGLNDTRVNTLLLTDNLLWIGYGGGGLGVLDYNYTPMNPADDRYWTFNADADRLPDDNVVALLRDLAGAVWVGTPGGLAKIDVSVFPFLAMEFADLQPADGSVLSLEVDAGNNLWVGTVKGLARIPDGRLMPDSVWLVGETPIPDNQVNGLTFDPDASVMWVATENGLGRLPVLTIERPDEPPVYPNPLVLRYSGDFATFAVPFGTRIDIYTLAGDRVRTVGWTGSESVGPRWDGRNDAGELVASGLYVFRTTYLDGSTGRGRIGVVRQR